MEIGGGEREEESPFCWKRATAFLPLIYLFNLRMLVRDIWQTGREANSPWLRRGFVRRLP